MITVKESRPMVAFGSMFPEQEKSAAELEKQHKQKMESLTDPSLRRQEEIAYAKALQNLATAILKEDKKLQLKKPFALNAKALEAIKANPMYYLHEGIISSVDYPVDCIVCGKRITKGMVMLSDTQSGVATCLDCVEPGKHTVNEDFVLEIVSK